jgi:hypothetical protein
MQSAKWGAFAQKREIAKNWFYKAINLRKLLDADKLRYR